MANCNAHFHYFRVVVRLGDRDVDTDPDCVGSFCAPSVMDVDIEEKVVCDGHEHGLNDIALIRLARPVAFSGSINRLLFRN